MGSIETVSVQKCPDVGFDLALLAERQVVERTGCRSQREGEMFTFSMDSEGEPMLVRSAIRSAIEETGCFSLGDESVDVKRQPAIADGSGGLD